MVNQQCRSRDGPVVNSPPPHPHGPLVSPSSWSRLVISSLGRLPGCLPSSSRRNCRGRLRTRQKHVSNQPTDSIPKESPACAPKTRRTIRFGTCSRSSALLAERRTQIMSESTVLYALRLEAGSVVGRECSWIKETKEMSGSRGEANFVWKCKNCKVWRHQFWRHQTPCRKGGADMISENRLPPSRAAPSRTSSRSRPSLRG